jgi:hypothetical protein
MNGCQPRSSSKRLTPIDSVRFVGAPDCNRRIGLANSSQFQFGNQRMIAVDVPERIQDGICLEEPQSIATVGEALHEHLRGALIVPKCAWNLAGRHGQSGLLALLLSCSIQKPRKPSFSNAACGPAESVGVPLLVLMFGVNASRAMTFAS